MKNSMSLNSKAIVSSKGQVVIPRVLREKMGIHAGNELLFKIRADGVIEIRQLERSIDMFFGRCKDDDGLSPVNVDEAVAQAIIDNDQASINEGSK